jgi:hypothetical protein
MKPYIKGLYKQRENVDKKIKSYQDKCKHLNVNVIYRASTGNYDPSNDVYWMEFKCPDCDKFWSETVNKMC